MPEETVVAAPPAAPEAPSLEIPRSGTAEYTKWRIDGTLPQKKTAPTTADPATASEPADISTASAAEPTPQEKPKGQQQPKARTAQERIKQIEATIEKLWEQPEPDTFKIAQLTATIDRIDAGFKRKVDPATTSQPSPVPTPKTFQSQALPAAPQEPNIENKNPDGSPKYNTYEEFVKAQARWEARQEWHEIQQQERQKAQAAQLTAEVASAYSRYGDAFNVSKNAFTAATLGPNGEPLIPVEVLSTLDGSEYLADVIHVIGSNPDDLATFVQAARTDPRKANRYIARVEMMIEDATGKGATATSRNDRGQFVPRQNQPEAPPARRGPESTPEPPIEIGNRGSGPLDDSERALKEIERGNPTAIRAWMKAENAKDLRRRKGL